MSINYTILKSGHIEITEKSDEGVIATLVRPDEPIPEKYIDVIEKNNKYDKYRTQENADAWKIELDRIESLNKEQKKAEAEEKARQKALDQLIKKEMDESGITAELEKEKDKIDKEK